MTATLAPPARSGPGAGAGGAYRPDIDGLRAVAILLVVAYHAGVERLAGGYVGVDVFFVLSGYLITGLLLREIERTGTVDLRAFYARRIRRLLPLSSLVLVTTMVLGLALLPPLTRVELLRDVRASALYVSNWRFSRLSVAYADVEVSQTPLVHFWSLSIEEQFYVLWPLMLLATVWWLRRSGRTELVRSRLLGLLVGIVVVSLAASLLLTPRIGSAAYYVTHTRLWELGAGGVLAFLLPRLAPLSRGRADGLAAAGLVAVVVAALTFDAGTPFPGSAALLPVAGTVLLLIAGTQPAGRLPQLLARWPLPNLGRWSYAWYLWHWPALGLLAVANSRRDDPLSDGAVVLVAVVASLGLAGLSHHLIENPMRHAAVLRRPARSFVAGAVLTLLPVGAVAGYLTFGDTGDRLVAATEAVEERPASAPTDVWSGFRADRGPVSPSAAAQDAPTSDLTCGADRDDLEAIRSCVFGDPDGERIVVVVGDSHAAQWLPAVHEVGVRRGWQVLLATMGACPLTVVDLYDTAEDRPFTACARFREEVLDELEALGPVHAVVVGRTADTASRVLAPDGSFVEEPARLEQLWQTGSAELFDRLLDSAEHVIALRGTPGASEDVPGCLSAAPDDPTSCDLVTAGWEQDGEAVLHRAEVAAGRGHGARVHHLDVAPLVCGTQRCRTVTPDGTIKFRDRAHLTSRFVRQLAPAFDALLPAEVRRAGQSAGG